MTANLYAAELERMRWLLVSAAGNPDLSDALRTLAKAEAIERAINRPTEAPICVLIREAIVARHRDRGTAEAALPGLREAARKASEATIKQEGQHAIGVINLYHLNGVSVGLSQAVEIVERAALSAVPTVAGGAL